MESRLTVVVGGHDIFVVFNVNSLRRARLTTWDSLWGVGCGVCVGIAPPPPPCRQHDDEGLRRRAASSGGSRTGGTAAQSQAASVTSGTGRARVKGQGVTSVAPWNTFRPFWVQTFSYM